MSNFTRSLKDLGPLHDLLLRACPPDDAGMKSVPILAKTHLNMTPFGVYKWIRNAKIPPEKAAIVVQINNDYWAAEKKAGREVSQEELVSLEDFHPFVYL